MPGIDGLAATRRIAADPTLGGDPGPHPHHVRPRRVRLRGAAGRGERVPGQGHRAGRAAARRPGGRRRATRCSRRGVTRRLIDEFADAQPAPSPGGRRAAGAAHRARARGDGARRRGPVQRRDRRAAVRQPGHRQDPRQPGDGQARRATGPSWWCSPTSPAWSAPAGPTTEPPTSRSQEHFVESESYSVLTRRQRPEPAECS